MLPPTHLVCAEKCLFDNLIEDNKFYVSIVCFIYLFIYARCFFSCHNLEE